MSTTISTSAHGASRAPAVGRQPLAVQFLLAAGLAAATLTLHGSLHHLLSIAFEAPPIVAACIVLARRFAQAPGGRPWVLYSIATIILVVVFDVLGVLAGLSNDPGSLFGLFQRLEFFTAVGWIALLAGRLLTGPDFEA